MRKELRHIIVIFIAALCGNIVGYILGKIQLQQLQDPHFIHQLMNHHMMIHEPIGLINSMILGKCIFAGVATGLLFYNHFSCKWNLLRRVIIGIVTFPFYAVLGIVGVIPYFIYNVVQLFKTSR